MKEIIIVSDYQSRRQVFIAQVCWLSVSAHRDRLIWSRFSDFKSSYFPSIGTIYRVPLTLIRFLPILRTLAEIFLLSRGLHDTSWRSSFCVLSWDATHNAWSMRYDEAGERTMFLFWLYDSLAWAWYILYAKSFCFDARDVEPARQPVDAIVSMTNRIIFCIWSLPQSQQSR